MVGKNERALLRLQNAQFEVPHNNALKRALGEVVDSVENASSDPGFRGKSADSARAQFSAHAKVGTRLVKSTRSVDKLVKAANEVIAKLPAEIAKLPPAALNAAEITDIRQAAAAKTDGGSGASASDGPSVQESIDLQNENLAEAREAAAAALASKTTSELRSVSERLRSVAVGEGDADRATVGEPGRAGASGAPAASGVVAPVGGSSQTVSSASTGTPAYVETAGISSALGSGVSASISGASSEDSLTGRALNPDAGAVSDVPGASGAGDAYGLTPDGPVSSGSSSLGGSDSGLGAGSGSGLLGGVGSSGGLLGSSSDALGAGLGSAAVLGAGRGVVSGGASSGVSGGVRGNVGRIGTRVGGVGSSVRGVSAGSAVDAEGGASGTGTGSASGSASGRGLAGGTKASAAGAAAESESAGGTPMTGGSGAGGTTSEKKRGRGLGGPIAPKLDDDDEELRVRTAAYGAGSRGPNAG